MEEFVPSKEGVSSTAEDLKEELLALIEYLSDRLAKGLLIVIDGIDRLRETPQVRTEMLFALNLLNEF